MKSPIKGEFLSLKTKMAKNLKMTFYSIGSLVFYLQHHQTSLCRPLIKEKHHKLCNVARSKKQSSLLDIM